MRFVNARFSCAKGQPVLAEEWYVAGTQGIDCWRLQGHKVTPWLSYRDHDSNADDVAGARQASLTTFVVTPGDRVAAKTRHFAPPADLGGMRLCARLSELGVTAR